jgi:hypothetical protein
MPTEPQPLRIEVLLWTVENFEWDARGGIDAG